MPNNPKVSQKIEEVMKSLKIHNCRTDSSIYNHSDYIEAKDVLASLTDIWNSAIEEERAICRQIFIEEVDWSEWAVSDEDAGKRFDQSRTAISKLRINK